MRIVVTLSLVLLGVGCSGLHKRSFSCREETCEDNASCQTTGMNHQGSCPSGESVCSSERAPCPSAPAPCPEVHVKAPPQKVIVNVPAAAPAVAQAQAVTTQTAMTQEVLL